jgi:hypothetical protein
MIRLAGCMGVLLITTGPAAVAQTTKVPNTLSAAEKKDGWKLLFDGKSLAGWTPRVTPPAGAALQQAGLPPAQEKASWAAEQGELVTVKEGDRWALASNQAYGDFTLRVEFWIDEGSNSGVFFRAPESGAINQGNAFEVNLFDKHPQWPTGSINGVQKTSGTPKTVGRWNALEIDARGDKLTVTLDGQKVVDATASRLPKGSISFQHAAGIKLRNVRIKSR